ncbi:MAG: hypothetical protein LAT61_11035 [Alcanivorax sp.]|nr:hypothetical protein [Alcanivorax sp.]
MAFFRGGRRADWKNGGIALCRAQKQLRGGTWPVGDNDDKSIVWQDHPRKEYGDDDYVQSPMHLIGDYLIYGMPRLAVPIGFISYLLLCWAIPNYIWQGEAAWMRQSAHISVFLAVLGFYYGLFSRYNQFVIFDRRNQLVHISHYFSRRFHSASWKDFDYVVLDCHSSFFGRSHSAIILTTPPPWSLRNHGLTLRMLYTSRMIDLSEEADLLDQSPRYRTEKKVEFIINFMTEKSTYAKTLNVTKEIDAQITCHAKDDFRYYRRKIKGPYSLIDPEKLPAEPNWEKDENEDWKKLRKSTIVRAGWFGLWGITHTLPPYLRGTLADPEHRDNPNAPKAGDRWHPKERGGTGELVGQPDEAIEAVLAEGMGALERFPEAAERARKAREEAVMHHNRNQSGINPPDA